MMPTQSFSSEPTIETITENPEISSSENTEVSTSENPEITSSENTETTSSENIEVSSSENTEVSSSVKPVISSSEKTEMPSSEESTIASSNELSTETQLPIHDSIDILFSPENCSINHRCQKIVSDNEYVVVRISVSEFKNFSQKTENGGAIYLINCGFNCKQTPFINCTSENGGGGAIYIKNSIDVKNEIQLENIDFIENSAIYGGAIYIYTVSTSNPITIESCKFSSNKATSQANSDPKLSGGSAIFLMSLSSCKVHSCYFLKNRGRGGSLKIYNEFDSSSSLLLQNVEINKNEHMISGCTFEIDTESNNAIYYIGHTNGIRSINIKECSFSGILEKQSHYIDGKLIVKNAHKLHIKSCEFEESNNCNIINVFNNQILEFINDNSVKEIKNKGANKIFVIMIIIFAFVTLMMYKLMNESRTKDQHEWNINEENDLKQNNIKISNELSVQSIL